MCQQCGISFADRVFIDGKWRHLHGRLYCVACRPFKARRSPRFITPRPVQMKTCVACGREFPSKLRINGVMRSLYRRKFCLECSPFGEHNTSKKPAGASDDADAFRKRRRTDSWVRYLRKRRRERKERLIALRGGKCEDCGYGTSSAALEFHHRDARTKEFGIGNMNGSWLRLLAEAEKCDLLCANCHQGRVRVRHGFWRSQRRSARSSTWEGHVSVAGASSCPRCSSSTIGMPAKRALVFRGTAWHDHGT